MAAGYWIFAWAIWWLVIALGAQGMSPLMGFLGLFSLPFLFRQRPNLTVDAFILIAFIVWTFIGSVLNGGSDNPIIVFDPSNQSYAIKSPVLLISLTLCLAGLGLWRTWHLSEKDYERVHKAAIVGMGIVFVLSFIGVIAMSFFEQILDQLSGAQDKQQNLIRALNMVVLSFPLFLAFLPFRRPIVVLALAFLIWISLLINAQQIDAEAPIIILLAMPFIAGLAALLGRWMYRLLGWVTGLYLVGGPWLIAQILPSLEKIRDTLPLSAQVRLNSYTYVNERIQEKWLTGWGIEAASTWKDTAPCTVRGMDLQCKIVPGHPHNMILENWAETGMIGALLLGLFAIVLGERLFRDAGAGRARVIAAAGIWLGALVHGSVSYSIWNDAFWMGILFLSTGIVLLHQLAKQKGEL